MRGTSIFTKNQKIEKELLNLSIEQLLEIEEIILKLIKQKLKNQTNDDWKKDFLEVSEWSHLNENGQVKVDKWTIETF